MSPIKISKQGEVDVTSQVWGGRSGGGPLEPIYPTFGGYNNIINKFNKFMSDLFHTLFLCQTIYE